MLPSGSRGERIVRRALALAPCVSDGLHVRTHTLAEHEGHVKEITDFMMMQPEAAIVRHDMEDTFGPAAYVPSAAVTLLRRGRRALGARNRRRR